LPLLSKLTLNGYPLLYRKPLAKRINANRPLAADRVRSLAAELASRFPSA
jgi:hypothetical protein